MIDYSFSKYLELLRGGTQKLLPGMKTGYLPHGFTFGTEASLDKLEKIIMANGFLLYYDAKPVMKLFQHESDLISGVIHLSELVSYGKILTISEEKNFEYKDAVAEAVPAIIYNSSFRYQAREQQGLEIVAEVTERIMEALQDERISAFWRMETARQLPIIASNVSEQIILH